MLSVLYLFMIYHEAFSHIVCRLTRTENLRGIENDVTRPFDLLKCTFEARVEGEKCHESLDTDGEAFDYCTISRNL